MAHFEGVTTSISVNCPFFFLSILYLGSGIDLQLPSEALQFILPVKEFPLLKNHVTIWQIHEVVVFYYSTSPCVI